MIPTRNDMLHFSILGEVKPFPLIFIILRHGVCSQMDCLITGNLTRKRQRAVLSSSSGCTSHTVD